MDAGKVPSSSLVQPKEKNAPTTTEISTTKHHRDALKNSAEPSISDKKGEEHHANSTRDTQSQQGRIVQSNAASATGDKPDIVSSDGSIKENARVPVRKRGVRIVTDEPVDGRGITGDDGVRGGTGSGSSFQITDDIELGEGGQKTKFKNNIKAIEELRKPGLPDQSLLVKYVGWGGIPQAFYKPDGFGAFELSRSYCLSN